jgi:hypothetical protein
MDESSALVQFEITPNHYLNEKHHVFNRVITPARLRVITLFPQSFCFYTNEHDVHLESINSYRLRS